MPSIRWEALNHILKPEHKQAGFYLEDDEDFLYLKRDRKTVAIWLATVATVPMVQAEADRLLGRIYR